MPDEKPTLRAALRNAAHALLQASELIDENVALAEPMNPVTREGKATLVRRGLVESGHYNGLGVVTIPAGGGGILRDPLNRMCWPTYLHLRTVNDHDPADQVLVTSITRAGLPVNIGAQAAPLTQFGAFSLMGETDPLLFLYVGQNFQVNLANMSDRDVTVVGGFDCDELTLFGEGMVMEQWIRERMRGLLK